MGTAYVDVEYIKANGVMTPDAVDLCVADLDAPAPNDGFRSLIEGRSAYIDSRLAKRYAVPFAAPYPEAVRQWCCDLVVERLLARRGGNPDSDLLEAATRAAELARTELREASDSETGLFDLPLRQATPAAESGIAKGGPYVYSEASPYEWIDVQTEAIRGR